MRPLGYFCSWSRAVRVADAFVSAVADFAAAAADDVDGDGAA